MRICIEIVVGIGCIYVLAWTIWPILNGQSERCRRWTSVVIGLLLPFAGLLVDREAKIVRVLIAILGILVSARIYSYWRSDQRRGFADYARFLSFGLLNPHLVYSSRGFSSRALTSLAHEAPRLMAAAIVTVIAVLVASALLSNTVADSWFSRYLIALAAFVVITRAFGVACGALWRMLGIRAKPLIDNIWLSRTPAEFWRRWSWPPHLWLNRYVYVPCGVRVHAAMAVVIVFLVSGLAHEVLAGVGLGRVTGHQTAFFLVSSLGVMASPLLERLTHWGLAGEIFMRLATIVFMIATTTVMFATFNKFIPLYQEPAWLDW